MVMPVPRERTDWTVDELDALEDDGKWYEIIDGGLFVTPAPRDTHQFVVVEFAETLHEYVCTEKFGRMMTSRADVRRGDRTRNRWRTGAGFSGPVHRHARLASRRYAHSAAHQPA